MADRPQLPPLIAAAIAEHAAGRISAEVAIMRVMLAGASAADLPGFLQGGLAETARNHAAGLAALERMVTAGATHAEGTGLADTRAMFDRLVALSPEASVAAYSLGDPALLDAATAELVAWLRGLGLLAARPRVLDLGCGIGRVAAAVAPEAGCVLGLDISPAMVAAARARHGEGPGLRFDTCSGDDLGGLGDAAFDLVLAVDVFPYLVQAGLPVAARMLAEAARVLRPGGQLVILNFSYGDPASDAAHLAEAASRCGLRPSAPGIRPFILWDAIAFRLVRSGVALAPVPDANPGGPWSAT